MVIVMMMVMIIINDQIKWSALIDQHIYVNVDEIINLLSFTFWAQLSP